MSTHLQSINIIIIIIIKISKITNVKTKTKDRMVKSFSSIYLFLISYRMQFHFSVYFQSEGQAGADYATCPKVAGSIPGCYWNFSGT